MDRGDEVVNKIGKNKKNLIAAVGLIFLGSITVIALGGLDILPEDDEQQPVEDELDDSYATPDEDSAAVDEQSTADAEVTVEIESSLSPSRPQVDINDPIEFQNQNDFPIRLEFDRSDQEPVIQPGESTQIMFRAVNYYDVYNDESDERITGGSVAVDF